MGFIDFLVKPLARSRATVAYPRRPADAVRTARVPRFEPASCTDDRSCVTACPTTAITIEPSDGDRRWSLDYGKCVFCAECIRVCPSQAIAGTGDYELSSAGRKSVVAEFILGSQSGD